MTDKIIDEVMSLISDWSEKDFLWGSAQIDAQSEMATSADFFNEKRYGEEAKSAKDAIRAKLREVLERGPLDRDDVSALVETAGYQPSETVRQADFINGVRYAEKHHGIGS